MRSLFNFSPGPAMLPEEIMLLAQAEFMDWQGTGKSVVEISHRSDEFQMMVKHAEQTLRELLGIPADYHILFLAGGATQQFSVAPMNLLRSGSCADYLHTGVWSSKAIQAAAPYIRVNVVCSGETSGFTTIPDRSGWRLNPEANWCYYCANETIGGLEFNFIPDVGTVPLVTDMTSSILSRQIDISKFGLIIAGAQKNIAPAGMTIVIIKDSLCGEALPVTPDPLNYRLQAEAGSMLNTPPVFNWYMANLMFDWVKHQGGVAEMEKRNQYKASMLYDVIDTGTLYKNNIDKKYRSNMNVVFSLSDEGMQSAFLEEATRAGLHGLKGHRLRGDLRASIYNAMPVSGVERLANFMREFKQKYERTG